MAVLFQVVCTILIIVALIFFIRKNDRSVTGASKAQMFLAGFQIVLCGWFFALCLSDVLDVGVNFSPVRFILNVIYGIAFMAISIYTLFNKYKRDDKYLKTVIGAFILLFGVQCFVFPYETEQELLRIFGALEGAVVYGLLIAILIKLDDEKFCQKSLFAATVLELAVAVENVIVPFATITEDFQTIDIPLNYAALFMRPVLMASLALTYRVWLDRKK